MSRRASRVLYEEDGLLCRVLRPGEGSCDAALDLMEARLAAGRASLCSELFLPGRPDFLEQRLEASAEGRPIRAELSVKVPEGLDGGCLLLLVALAGCLPSAEEAASGELGELSRLSLSGDALWLGQCGLGPERLRAAFDAASRLVVELRLEEGGFSAAPLESWSLSRDASAMEAVVHLPALSVLLGLEAPGLSEEAEELCSPSGPPELELLGLVCSLADLLPVDEGGESGDEFPLAGLLHALGLEEDQAPALEALLARLGRLSRWRAERFEEIVDQEEGGARVERGEAVWRLTHFG